MNNALLVTIANGMNYLPEFTPRIRFGQSAIPSYQF